MSSYNASDRPNILLLMTDEQRFDHLGAVNKVVKTPNLDSLARDGVLFTRAYTSNPSCVPARAAILTGKYPHQCACPTFITYLPDHETTFTSLLQNAGYYTAYVGKLHVGETNIELGLDYQDIVDSHYPRPQDPDANSYQKWLFDEGFTLGDQLIEGVEPRHSADWKVDPKYHVDNYVGHLGEEWIKCKTPDDKPWFCTVSFPGPHMPIDCGSFREAQLYDPECIDMPSTTYEMLAGKPPHNSMAHGEPPIPYKPLSTEDIRKQRRAYYANITVIDTRIGEIISELKAKGLYDNTVVIFVADHGDYLGDFALNAKGQNVPEVLMRIPFIVKPVAGRSTAKRESSLISSVDIAATCLSIGGAYIPIEMASQDLSRYWENDSDLDDRHLLYMEAGGIRVLRDRRWKYCHYKDRDYGELYDLQNDPYETKNLWDSADQAERKAEFSRKMVDKLIELSPRSSVQWNKGAPVL